MQNVLAALFHTININRGHMLYVSENDTNGTVKVWFITTKIKVLLSCSITKNIQNKRSYSLCIHH